MLFKYHYPEEKWLKYVKTSRQTTLTKNLFRLLQLSIKTSRTDLIVEKLAIDF